MNYKIDFFEVFKYLIPTRIRGAVHAAWLAALLKPLSTLNGRLETLVSQSRYFLAFNGQVILLEHVLNDRFDPGQRRIFIDDPLEDAILPTFVFNRVEGQPDLYIYNQVEGQPDTFVYNAVDFVTTTDFLVMIPSDVFSTELEILIKSLVDEYRKAGSRYQIQTF